MRFGPSVSVPLTVKTMSSFPFSKYHGLGNHFVFVDNRKGLYDFNDPQLIREICCTRTGVGADCLLEVIDCRHGDHKSCAFGYLNRLPSGLVGGFCGNGSRCLADFARKLGIVSNDGTFTFCGPDGQHRGRHLAHGGLVEISIRDVNKIDVYNENSYFIFTGTPVHVEFVPSVQDINLQTFGDKIRFDTERYPNGTNVMIVEDNERGITMRSYERSIDGETWSCGTGTTAVAIATDLRNNKFFESDKEFTKEINVRLGKLCVKAKRVGETSYTNISLTGPACHVFDGTYFQS